MPQRSSGRGRVRNNAGVVLFSIYAVVVWFAAARYRRRWGSVAAVGAGVAGLVLVAMFHIQLARWTNGRIFLPALQLMLYPYTALVALVGAYLSCLPRIIPPTACASCEYDLRGLQRRECPECGREMPEVQRSLVAGLPTAKGPGPVGTQRRRVTLATPATSDPPRGSAPAIPV